nr:putative atp-dependent helicase c17a2.12 [Quercus suber]
MESEEVNKPGLHGSPGTQGFLDDLDRSGLSPDTQDFLDDLSHYLPLGCLLYPPSNTGGGAYHDTLWSNIHRLASARWIRVVPLDQSAPLVLRVYILPFDVGIRYVKRDGLQSKKLFAALETLLREIDIDPEMWTGQKRLQQSRNFNMWATPEHGSLYYVFNTLTSPAPSVDDIPREKRYAREALEDLLDPSSTPGLKTILMPYQRRSASLMLQREVAPRLELDPRLEERTAPDGSIFYYNPRELLFLRHPLYLEAPRGGILAETMGLGKTLMLLALILATKHHPPMLPEGQVALMLPEGQVAPMLPEGQVALKRVGVARLSQMAISAINRKGIPWQVELERVRHATGNDMAYYATILNASPLQYESLTAPARWNRTTMLPAPKTLTLAATTIIVVPQNLCKQWKSEIDKHVAIGSLRVLVMETKMDALPPPDVLRTYDVVLFSRQRFDSEAKDGHDTLGRVGNQRLCRCPYIGATRTRDCTCVRVEDVYDSPLKYLHFKRLIVDEGHFFSNSGSNATLVANKLITVDHRWVVSGTPAKNLFGVEVDTTLSTDLKTTRDEIIHQRREFSKEDKDGAIQSIASLIQHFLRVRPWAASFDRAKWNDRAGWNDRAEWNEHIFRHETLRGRSYSGFSRCLRRTLESIIIKTQFRDVEKDLILPPLNYKVVYLKPSFYDKLTANIFTTMLIANAVASERTDADFLFHKSSAKARHELVSNLRQSAFFWTGFSTEDLLSVIKNSKTYLNKIDAQCSKTDRDLLTDAIHFTRTVLTVEGWQAMERSHELGIFVERWPKDSAEHWAFEVFNNDDVYDDDDVVVNLMTGISPLLEAQRHVNCRTALENPGDGLAGAGVRALAEDSTSKIEHIVRGSRKAKDATTKSATTTPTKKETSQGIESQNLLELPPSSPYRQTHVVGTASAKLTYLTTQILEHQLKEKIIIFYDGKNVAYYIAQMLELLHIKHEIYDSSLPARLKSEYVVRFDQELQDRVLLMDVKQAAFGLNLSSASRIYFVNPVCRPDIEAQAIKRAHRFGQTRQVYVETLVLEGTIEEKMLERSKRMTRAEHADASKLEDDGGIREIIQSAQLLPIDLDESRIARVETPQRLWGRDGWRDFIKAADVVWPTPSISDRREDAASGLSTTTRSQPAQPMQTQDGSIKQKKRSMMLIDNTDHDASERFVEEESLILKAHRPRKRVQVAFDTSITL